MNFQPKFTITSNMANALTSIEKARRTLQRNLKLLVEKGFIRELVSSPTDPMKYTNPYYDKLRGHGGTLRN
jgi:hypothetical protein